MEEGAGRSTQSGVWLENGRHYYRGSMQAACCRRVLIITLDPFWRSYDLDPRA